LQWAAAHDNEAGYIDIPAMVITRGIQYPVYVNAADGTVKAKGAPFVEFIMENVTPAQYETMRVTDLGFSATDLTDVSKEVTVTVYRTDRATLDNWNATLVHRPHVDAEWDGEVYSTVRWLFKMLEAT
jgi:hypothetical protein